MTRSTSRRATGAALGLAALLALSACGGNVRTGAAAVVGDERISAEQLEAVVTRGLADPAAAQANEDRAAYQRSVLTRLINGIVLRKAADEAGVTITEAAVDEQLQTYIDSTPSRTLAELEQQAAQQAGIAKQDLRPFIRDLVLDLALGDKLTEELPVSQAELQELYAQNPAYDRVRSAHILVADEARADSILAQVKADPTRFAALAKQFSTDTSNKDTGGDLGLVGKGSFVPEFEDAVFAAKVGDVLKVKTQFGFHVVAVRERVTTPLADVTDDLRRQVLQDAQTEAKAEALRKAAADLGIRVSPRFGTWSSEGGQVVERESTLSTPAPDGDAPVGEAPLGEAPPAS